VANEPAPSWTALLRRGLDQLSPPEVERALFELPADRPEYVKTVQDMSGWPIRVGIGRRIPSEQEIDRLNRLRGRWRAVTLLEDDRATALAASLFTRVFVLDPLYDTGDLLYAGWHDDAIRDEHARHLAEHGSQLVRLAPLLRSGVAMLAPHHLPGSWDPRPGWRRLRPDADAQTVQAWKLRQALILLYWADRLDAVICTSTPTFPPGLVAEERSVRVAEPASIEAAAAADRPRRTRRLEGIRRLDAIADALERVVPDRGAPQTWRLQRHEQWVAEPALLLRRALDGRDLDAQPLLPRAPLRREPLCLLAT
jgi:hypothetical protein